MRIASCQSKKFVIYLSYMKYLKNFLICFFIVFFVNYLFPGIDIVNQSKLPHIGGDFTFAAILGLLNSLLYPALFAIDRQSTILRLSVVTFILNFLAYALLKLLPFGVYVTRIEGYLTASSAVSFGSIILNYIQFKKTSKSPSQH